VVAYVERRRVTFVGGRVPLLILRGVPEADALPPLVLTEASAGPCANWEILAKLTACTLDGPDQVGFYIGALADRHDVERQRGWLAQVEAAGGVIVVATDDIAPIRSLADLVGRKGLRGGFVCVAGSRGAAPRP
jgi:hypothetical protein